MRWSRLFDVAALPAHKPVPAGNRVVLVTNAGGPGIMAADACEANGLTLPPLSGATTRALARVLPPDAPLNNTVDMIASAPPQQFEETIKECWPMVRWTPCWSSRSRRS